MFDLDRVLGGAKSIGIQKKSYDQIYFQIIPYNLFHGDVLRSSEENELNRREYHRLARHLSAKLAQNIPFCSIFPFFQYSLIHDLALRVGHNQKN